MKTLYCFTICRNGIQKMSGTRRWTEKQMNKGKNKQLGYVIMLQIKAVEGMMMKGGN
jgi:hypothetical protein